MSIYNGMSGKESNLEESYVFLDLAGQVALRVGSILYLMIPYSFWHDQIGFRTPLIPPCSAISLTACSSRRCPCSLGIEGKRSVRQAGGSLEPYVCCPLAGTYVRANLPSPSISDICVDTFRAWSLDVLQVICYLTLTAGSQPRRTRTSFNRARFPLAVSTSILKIAFRSELPQSGYGGSKRVSFA